MKKFILILLAVIAIGTAYAGEEEIKEKLETALPNTKVDSIKMTGMDGLFEITSGKNILYVDKEVKYLFVGGIYDLSNNKNLTEARLKEINRVEFNSLNLDNAIKTGTGKRKIAIFYDPDCPYCRSQYQELKKIGITTYIFLYPLPMHQQAYGKSVTIWCSKDKVKTLEDMLSGKSQVTDKTCNNPIDQNIEIGDSLGITATPTMILDSGEMISGFITSDDLKKRMGIDNDK